MLAKQTRLSGISDNESYQYAGQFYSEKDFVNIKSESVLVLFQLLNIGSMGLEPLQALMLGKAVT